MAGLVYYIPNVSGASVDLDDLVQCGLRYAFDDAPTCAQVLRGPGGSGRGLVIADAKTVPVRDIGFYEARQTWLKIPKSECWVGFVTDARPTPVELSRKTQLTGHQVKLADDQCYLIPVARAFDLTADSPAAAIALPRTMGVDEDGRWIVAGVVPRFQRLWDVATRWFDAVRGAASGEDGVARFDFEDIADSALAALQANYRVGAAEVTALGLFDDRCAVSILQALIDWSTLEEWSKKKSSSAGTVGASIGHGVADS